MGYLRDSTIVIALTSSGTKFLNRLIFNIRWVTQPQHTKEEKETRAKKDKLRIKIRRKRMGPCTMNTKPLQMELK
jgi:hypothetical protein